MRKKLKRIWVEPEFAKLIKIIAAENNKTIAQITKEEAEKIKFKRGIF